MPFQRIQQVGQVLPRQQFAQGGHGGRWGGAVLCTCGSGAG